LVICSNLTMSYSHRLSSCDGTVAICKEIMNDADNFHLQNVLLTSNTFQKCTAATKWWIVTWTGELLHRSVDH